MWSRLNEIVAPSSENTDGVPAQPESSPAANTINVLKNAGIFEERVIDFPRRRATTRFIEHPLSGWLTRIANQRNSGTRLRQSLSGQAKHRIHFPAHMAVQVGICHIRKP